MIETMRSDSITGQSREWRNIYQTDGSFAVHSFVGSGMSSCPKDLISSLVERLQFRLPKPFLFCFLTNLVAILGTTISPYLFFWQANQGVEEEISMGRKTLRARKGATDKELK